MTENQGPPIGASTETLEAYIDGGGNGGSQPGTRVTLDVTSAMLKSLETGTEFGPTPDAGKMVVPIAAVWTFNVGAIFYDGGSHPLISTLAAFAADSGNAWGETGIGSTTEESSAAIVNMVDTISVGGAAVLDGQRLALVGTGDWTTGDGTAVLDVWYLILDAPVDQP